MHTHSAAEHRKNFARVANIISFVVFVNYVLAPFHTENDPKDVLYVLWKEKYVRFFSLGLIFYFCQLFLSSPILQLIL